MWPGSRPTSSALLGSLLEGASGWKCHVASLIPGTFVGDRIGIDNDYLETVTGTVMAVDLAAEAREAPLKPPHSARDVGWMTLRDDVANDGAVGELSDTFLGDNSLFYDGSPDSLQILYTEFCFSCIDPLAKRAKLPALRRAPARPPPVIGGRMNARGPGGLVVRVSETNRFLDPFDDFGSQLGRSHDCNYMTTCSPAPHDLPCDLSRQPYVIPSVFKEFGSVHLAAPR